MLSIDHRFVAFATSAASFAVDTRKDEKKKKTFLYYSILPWYKFDKFSKINLGENLNYTVQESTCRLALLQDKFSSTVLQEKPNLYRKMKNQIIT